MFNKAKHNRPLKKRAGWTSLSLGLLCGRYEVTNSER